MYYHSFSAFLAMGGDAFYVWTAYGICALLIVGYLIALRNQRQQVKRQIGRLIEREQALAGGEK